MRRNVLIVSPHVFPQPHSGTGMRAHFQAVHLSKDFPVTVVSEAGSYEVKNGSFGDLAPAAVRTMGSFEASLRSLVSGSPYVYEKFGCRSWQVPSFEGFSHVIIHYSALLAMLLDRKSNGVRVILDTHNNDRQYFETVGRQSRNAIKRAEMRRQASVIERLVERVSGRLDATISVSEADREWIQRFCSSKTRHIVVPNNLFRYAPGQWSGAKTVLFVGTLNVNMNLQALDWFRRRVWQEVRELVPGVEFVVAGRDPSDELISELTREGIRVAPNPASLDALYDDALYSLVPSSSGSGGKIKVCEALSRGVPVLTTEHGLVGQPEAIRDCCAVSDDPKAWINAIAEQVGRNARSDDAWDRQVRKALDQSYFGNSILQVADFIRGE